MSKAKGSLSVNGVSLVYSAGEKSVLALDGISFEVRPNEFTVIVGPSGCGKSSLLYIAAGLTDATSGHIHTGGQMVTGPGADRGMVFQAYTLFPWLTVRNNVGYGLKRKGIAAAERQKVVDYYLGEVGLAAFADHYPKQLSGGMMQRVAIARALANDPDILLMDEPFGALDSQTRHTMQRLLLRVWEHAQKTVAFVTHDIDEAILLGDRVIVMTARPGKVKADIRIDIPRPRDPEIVLEPEFIAIKRRIINELRDEIDETH
ncbi:ABC transporter ATP-binding protein [Taklimakanibacter lacteus]|uniref:ABC transporter ATP-binding protein n=1 Tax=Taklimakanibacter lacteus TaxID=2268456 RepID=UPI000E6665DF